MTFQGADCEFSDAPTGVNIAIEFTLSLHIYTYDANDNWKICDYS